MLEVMVACLSQVQCLLSGLDCGSCAGCGRRVVAAQVTRGYLVYAGRVETVLAEYARPPSENSRQTQTRATKTSRDGQAETPARDAGKVDADLGISYDAPLHQARKMTCQMTSPNVLRNAVRTLGTGVDAGRSAGIALRICPRILCTVQY